MRVSFVLIASLAAGCSSQGPLTPLPDGGTSGTTRIVSAPYMLTGGQEIYLCDRITMTSDLLITSFIPVNGTATHHMLLGIDPTQTVPDGLAPCADQSGEFQALSWNLLFASGVGSPTLTMPPGVAVQVHKGDQLIYQMHLLNATPSAVSSNAALDVTQLAPGAMFTEAQMVLAGPLPDKRVTPDIPVGNGQIVNGTCTLPAATSYFAVFPHMHEIGVHIKVVTDVSGKSDTIYDAPYSFNNQVFAEFTPIAMKTGDTVNVTCTYDNMTGAPVPFGQSSYDEMCFAISYFFPPVPTEPGLGSFCPQ